MSARARRQHEKQERRESILDAAERVFFDKGFERCTMDDIARGASLSRGLLYVYFRDKSDMLEAVMLRAAETLRQRFRDVSAQGLSGGEQIQAMGQAYYAFSVEEPDYFDLLTRAASDWPSAGISGESLAGAPDDSAMALCSGEVMQIMATAIQRGVDDGSLSADHVRCPVQTALYLRGALHGVIMLTRQEAGHDLPDETAAQALVSYTLDMLGVSLRA
ncbi:MAG: TetR/AcrR family transcriptional regulator [Alcanivorax sp.]|nr:TetR/AcrR family transcriptional regulator [Alcanivorax sp.]